jgi:hypothetical protein
MYSFTILTSLLVGGEGLATSPGRFTPGEFAPGTLWIEGWVAPRAGLDSVERRTISVCLESNPARRACSHLQLGD